MAKKPVQAIKPETQPAPEPSAPTPFTGVAFTTQASTDAGFSNFRICTLFVVDGQIVHTEKSQEYALFETVARMEILIDRAHWHLSNRYRKGLFLGLGGDDRDKLVTRLKNEDPGLLTKIAPALGIEA
jgi:hypothetical protein